MNNLSKALLALLATGVLSCALLSQEAQATPINGTIQFAGAVAFNTNSLATATRVNTWFDVFNNAGFSNVTGGNTGDFAGIAPGTQAAMAQPWTFKPSTATPGLWSVGGFTFDLLTASVVTQNPSNLTIEGTGIVSGNGFDTTNMDWNFTSQSSGGRTHTKFSFSANGATTPDSGTTLMLLGAAVGALAIMRRCCLAS
jgi:VPDSG-CTERM motif